MVGYSEAGRNRAFWEITPVKSASIQERWPRLAGEGNLDVIGVSKDSSGSLNGSDRRRRAAILVSQLAARRKKSCLTTQGAGNTFPIRSVVR
jgi:hypothetical protein